MPAQIGQIEETIDAAQQVIRRKVVVEIEGIEELVLRAACATHHHIRLRTAYRFQASFCTSFSTH
jgi:hypothetical protein